MSTPLTSRRRSSNLLSRSSGKGLIISPQTRRSLQGQDESSTAHPVESPQLPEVRNDDDVRERREKRRSRTLTQAVNSPLARPIADNQGETAKLTNDQLASHYVNCIKLSTENKITAKNAFNLHLIDHMNEMLKQRCEGALNFQMAGGTIFASAKIYASRVDAVHSETYKVMSSLGRGAADEKVNEDHESQQDSKKQETGKKKKKRSKILESNSSSLRMKKMDASYQADPLDQYYSMVFDVASTSGLLVNHLGLCKDGITMRFDSDMESPITHNVCGGKIPISSDAGEQMQEDDQNRKEEIDKLFFELVKLASNEQAEKADVCPTVSDFHWMKDDSSEWHNDETTANGSEPLVSPDIDSQPDFEDIIMDSEPTNDEEDTVVNIFQSESSEIKTELSEKSGFPIGMDAELLTSFMPGEYSYFKPGAFSTWEGPNHWKMKLRNKAPASTGNTEKTSEHDQASRGKKRKKNFYIEYQKANFEVDDQDFEQKKSKGTSRRILEKWSKSEDDRLLPSAGEYSVPDLAKSVLQPSIQIRPVSLLRSSKEETSLPRVDSDQLGLYNYDNPNDKNNYCPNMTDDEDAGVQESDNGIPTDFDYNGMDHVEGFPDMTLSQTQVHGSQLDIEAMLQGDHLISHPKKVEKISIAYAKKATRIDVRRLKSAMWLVLHKNDVLNDESALEETSESSAKQNGFETEQETEASDDQKTFSNMYNTLPNLMPSTMTENLSIPLAFTCLLHLANEKSLEITAKSDMSDLNIVEPHIIDGV